MYIHIEIKRTSLENKNGKTQSKILRTTEWIIKSIKYYHPKYTPILYTFILSEENFIMLTNYTHTFSSTSDIA